MAIIITYSYFPYTFNIKFYTLHYTSTSPFLLSFHISFIFIPFSFHLSCVCFCIDIFLLLLLTYFSRFSLTLSSFDLLFFFHLIFFILHWSFFTSSFHPLFFFFFIRFSFLSPFHTFFFALDFLSFHSFFFLSFSLHSLDSHLPWHHFTMVNYFYYFTSLRSNQNDFTRRRLDRYWYLRQRNSSFMRLISIRVDPLLFGAREPAELSLPLSVNEYRWVNITREEIAEIDRSLALGGIINQRLDSISFNREHLFLSLSLSLAHTNYYNMYFVSYMSCLRGSL